MTRDYLREAGDVIFKDSLPAPLSALAEQNPSEVIGNLLRVLDVDSGLSSVMHRKAAAYALGQIGEPSTLKFLSARYDVENAQGVKEALAASMTAINLAGGPTHSEAERRRIIEDVYNGKRPAHFTAPEVVADDPHLGAEDYVRECMAELESAPPLFKSAFSHLSEGRLDKAASTFSGCLIAGGEGMTDEWAATAVCYAAYCVAELGDFEQAISMAEAAKKMGFLLNGGFYYYSAMFTALNQLDKLDEALRIAEEAVRFFLEHQSPGDVASNLGRKANILKQMASHLSRSPQPQRAQSVINEAVRAYCESLMITMAGWGEQDVAELSAMGQIASRVGVRRRDLTFLDTMPKVDAMVGRFFAS